MNISPTIDSSRVMVLDSGPETILIVTPEGEIQIPLTRTKLEELVKEKTLPSAAYVRIALEILRLREKCGESAH